MDRAWIGAPTTAVQGFMVDGDAERAGSTNRSADGPATLEGRFETAEAAAQAVEQLVDAQIPTGQIEVYTLDRSGHRGRKVKMTDGPGVKRGALVGAAVGACVGLLAFVTGSFGATEAPNLTLLHAMAYIGASGAAGVPLGAAIGMAGWGATLRLHTADLDTHPVVVVVRTGTLADEARRVLHAAGASRVG